MTENEGDCNAEEEGSGAGVGPPELLRVSERKIRGVIQRKREADCGEI